MKDQQGTSWETNWFMVWLEIKKLFSKDWKSARVGHKLWNVVIEAIRANPKVAAIVIIVLLFMVIGQTVKLTM